VAFPTWWGEAPDWPDNFRRAVRFRGPEIGKVNPLAEPSWRNPACFSRTGQDICSPLNRRHTANPARQIFGPAHDLITDNKQRWEPDSAIQEPRPTKSAGHRRICFGYRLLAILKP
jgi:hypothetical protein